MLWFDSLPVATKHDFGCLEAAFRQKYITVGPTDLQRQVKHLVRHQQPTESVDEYIADYRNTIQNFAYDNNMQMTLILNGLRAYIKAIVMQHLPFNNIEELTTKAKHVESALKSYIVTPSVSSVGQPLPKTQVTSPSLAVKLAREEAHLSMKGVEDAVRKAIEPLNDRLHTLSLSRAQPSQFYNRGFRRPGLSRPIQQRFQGRGRGNGNLANKRCFVCESRFHLQRDCPHTEVKRENYQGRQAVFP